MESAWNCVQIASARTKETIASPTTEAAGTAQVSLRSLLAETSAPVARSTVFSRDGLHRCAHDKGLTVRHAALKTSRAVGRTIRTAVDPHIDLIVDCAPRQMCTYKARTDLHTLDRLNGHHRARNFSVKARIPLRM